MIRVNLDVFIIQVSGTKMYKPTRAKKKKITRRENIQNQKFKQISSLDSSIHKEIG